MGFNTFRFPVVNHPEISDVGKVIKIKIFPGFSTGGAGAEIACGAIILF